MVLMILVQEEQRQREEVERARQEEECHRAQEAALREAAEQVPYPLKTVIPRAQTGSVCT